MSQTSRLGFSGTCPATGRVRHPKAYNGELWQQIALTSFESRWGQWGGGELMKQPSAHFTYKCYFKLSPNHQHSDDDSGVLEEATESQDSLQDLDQEL